MIRCQNPVVGNEINPESSGSEVVGNKESSRDTLVGIKSVVYDEEGRVMPYTRISLRKANFLKHPTRDNTPANSDTVTDSLGKFYFPEVEIGDFFVTAVNDITVGSGMAFSVERTDSLYEAEMTLEQLGCFSGRIHSKDALKNIVPRYMQIYGTNYLAEMISEGVMRHNTRIYDEYRFFIPNIPVGTYTLHFSDNGLKSESSTPFASYY